MDWLSTLRRSGGLHALSRKLEASPADVITASGDLLPGLLAAMRHFVDSHGGQEEGLQALVDLLRQMGDGKLAADVMGPEPLRVEAGEQLLDELLKSREPVPGLATDALQAKLLPALAMLVGGYLGARAVGSGTDVRSGLEQVAEMLELNWPTRRRGAASWDQAG